MSCARTNAIGWMMALVALMVPCGCASQQGGSPWTSWLSSLTNKPAPAPVAVVRTPAPRAQQWRDVQPEIPKAQQPPQQRAVEEQEPKPKPTPSGTSPQPTVTSTMNAASRQEAEAAISEVDQRLALANTSDPAGKVSEQIKVIRKLRDSAQQALNEQDYLTAQSLAQKASVLAAQLPRGSGAQPSPSSY